MKTIWSGFSLFITLSILTMPVFSSNLKFLEDTVISSFNDEDFKLMTSAIKKALDNNKDGEVTTWKNSETGNAGAIAPANTFEKDGMTCRRIKIINRSGEKKGKSEFNYCKVADGSWKIVSK